MIDGPTGHDLVSSCTYAVRFNEDEATVQKDNYMDAMYCMGVMDGLTDANEAVRREDPKRAFFCLPNEGIKTWLVAKVIVDFSKSRPDLLTLQEIQYAILALASAYPCTTRG
ncbi:hypothetical protein EC912_10341 [Luteibacter rhizovicinus]|uniref:Rap1a immunity protein domain-containing protein n=2 Tax=Luteibacter rhizovicinus TaxID=242606 RepID=A0A4R3YS91_9GAMM|nr:hypothetical protein EC912_10341 [Luteibacter rhizovicinus]